jgi:uncharacterized membrane protein
VNVADAFDDQRIEMLLGELLRYGVLLSAAVVAIGGAAYLYRHGDEVASYRQFGDGTPTKLRSPKLVVIDAMHGGGRALVQLGLLLLIATPVARVAFSAVAFARQRDWTYVAMTLFVLVVLLFSLFHRGA